MSVGSVPPAEKVVGLRRPLTMEDIRERLWGLPDGPERSSLEDWYFALAAERYGQRRALWYRREYEWVRSHR